MKSKVNRIIATTSFVLAVLMWTWADDPPWSVLANWHVQERLVVSSAADEGGGNNKAENSDEVSKFIAWIGTNKHSILYPLNNIHIV